MKKSKLGMFLLVVTLAIGTFTSSVFANEPTVAYDMTTAITESVNAMSTQVFAIIGIVVPVVLTIVGGKLVITKGISVFKTLTGKA